MATIACDLNKLFNLLSIVVGVTSTVSGIKFIFSGFFQATLVGFYVCLFGIATVIFEVLTPAAVLRWFPWMSTFLGKGLFFIFLGCIAGGNAEWYLFVLIFDLIVGFLYVILNFVAIGGVSGPRAIYATEGGVAGGTTVEKTTVTVTRI